jgi:tellurite methyltransferase
MIEWAKAIERRNPLHPDQKRWDRKYKAMKFLQGKKPNAFLKKHLHFLPRGNALDLACGDGTNAVFLAEQGFRVEAVDISPVGLRMARRRAREKAVKVRFRQADLNSFPLRPNFYDLITVFYFLNRRLIPRIKRALKEGGMIVYETYTNQQAKLGTGGPIRASYLLKPHELRNRFSEFHILIYREGIFLIDGRRCAIASLIAKKPKTDGKKPAKELR